MLSKADFLEAVIAKAKKAVIARILNISPARVSEMYNGRRDLSYDEAVKLAHALGIEQGQHVTAELLAPILNVCLRYAPREWMDRDVERLAQEIIYGLGLLQRVSPSHPSQDAIDVVGHAVADRIRNRPD